jgi:hypothetical protein
MERGLLIDHAHYGVPYRQSWLAGETSKGWLGERMPKGKPIPVTTWRCGSCGYLESYASSD